MRSEVSPLQLSDGDTSNDDGYPEQVEQMGKEDGSGRTNDPMDVARAIAGLIAQPPGTRPLRLPVSGGAIPQTPINRVTAEVQTGWLGNSPYGPMIHAVHDG